MRKPIVRDLHDRLPAVIATAAFHVAVVAALLNAMASYTTRHRREREVTITLAPEMLPKSQIRHAPGATRSGAISHDQYRLYRLPPSLAQRPDLRGLNLALTACAPENWANLSPDIRDECRRIDVALAADPNVLDPKYDVKDPSRWALELAIKQGPLLLPCASPDGLFVDLATLACIADMIENGYHPEKMQHYSK